MPRSVKPPKDPNAPKKPQSSYFLFSNERRKILAQENPTKKITEISTLISSEWKLLTADLKQKYVDKAAELKKEYQIVSKEYKQTENYTNFQKKLEAWKESQKQTNKLKKKKNDSDDSDDDESDMANNNEKLKKNKAKKNKSKKSSKKAPKKPKQPADMPKRPQSSYFLFSNERRPQLRQQYPDRSVTELSKLISNEWNHKTDEEKKVYIDKAAELKKIYEPQIAEFKETEAYKNYLMEQAQYKKDKKRFDEGILDSDDDEDNVKVSLPRKPKDKNAPKKPLSSYFLYAKDVRESVKAENPNSKITEIAKLISAKWKVLDENDKQKYNETARELKAKYDIEMAEYKKSDLKEEYDNEVKKWEAECQKRKLKALEAKKKKKQQQSKQNINNNNNSRSNKLNKKNKNKKKKKKQSSSDDDSDDSDDDDNSNSSSDSNSNSDSNSSDGDDSDTDDSNSNSNSDSDTGSDSNSSDSDSDSDNDDSDNDDSDNDEDGDVNMTKKRKNKSSNDDQSSSDDDSDSD